MTVGIIILAVPLGCWLLAAPKGWARPVIAAVLAAATLTAAAGMLNWLPQQVRWTGLVGAGCVLAVLPLVGLALVWPVHKGESGDRRGFAAALMVGCALLMGAASWLFGSFLHDNGRPAEIPAASELAPLPAGLLITSERSGCGSGSADFCEHDLDVGGTSGQNSGQVLDQVRGHLTASGWPLATDSRGGWSACRTHGSLLDAYQVCVSVAGTDTGAAVTLGTTSKW
ncbi:hypothetical protein [Kitasatospora sp. NPDC048407]|uniref:hypothetical protein n=1 Tax=Kitasatospora sp. NPDC048407 TaxID=3364051 RepID=UPI00372136A3